MRVTLSVKRIGGKQGALLVERKSRIVGLIAPLQVGTGTILRKGAQARVGRIVQFVLESRGAAVPEQAGCEGINSCPRQAFLHVDVATAGCRVLQVERHRAGDRRPPNCGSGISPAGTSKGSE
jgi:hypothetical protein